MTEVTCVCCNPDTLGECPLWDFRHNRLLWVDSLQKKIHAFHPNSGQRQSWEMPDQIGSIGLRAKGGLIAAFRNGFHFVDLETGEVTPILDPEAEIADTRLNDGKCDRQGRFWCGSMNENFAKPNASLYRLDPDLSCHKMDSGFTVSNGIAWSLDDRVMYFSDSRVAKYYQYDFDAVSGKLSNRRSFANPDLLEGRIDGATVDSDGNYWCALFNSTTVACIDSEGHVIRRIELPVRYPTMCNFGGEDMKTLYVTSATFPIKPEKLNVESQDGGLFSITGLGVSGIPEPFFSG